MSIQTEKTKPAIQINSKTGLIPAKNVFYWVSLDSQHQAIKFGIGEARPETVKFAYNLLTDSPNLQEPESYKKFFESLSTIKNTSNIKPIKLLRDPIVNPVHSQFCLAKLRTVAIINSLCEFIWFPLKIKRIDELTMNDIAEYKYMPNAFLTQINQQLFSLKKRNVF
jgi:hypothetical protein